ncbi:MAG TPA: hypothetical protein VFO16_23070 [Pseudonocardiaceae bacterium]|nr:hypothetical protein [Pseudonocardiaceae bacterium]
MTNVSNVFQYGASESNGRSMGIEEQLEKTSVTGEVAPPRPDGPGDGPLADTGGGPVTVRLVLMAMTIILLGTAAGLAGALILPKTYGARAEVLYSVGQDQGGDPLKQDRQLSTQLVLLKSPRLLGDIARKQGRQVKDLDKEVSVQVLANSNVIQVEADGSSKLAAMQTLQAVIDGYLALASQPTGATRYLETQLADAQAKTQEQQTRVTQLTSAVLAGTATQVALNDARAQLTGALDQEKAIQNQINQAKLRGEGGPPVQLLTPPYSLPDVVFPQPWIAAGTGALVGVIVAGAMVALGARRPARP